MISVTYQSLYYTWVALEVIVALVTRTRSGKGKVQDGGSMLLLWVVIMAAITACEWIRAAYGPNLAGNPEWWRVASTALFFIGFVIRCTAILTLGKSFSVNVAIRQSQRLKRTGLYRFVRHPSYSGLLLILLAIGVYTRNWISLVVLMIPTTAALLYRIRLEEAVLRGAFGAEYVDYSRQTSRLVPGLF